MEISLDSGRKFLKVVSLSAEETTIESTTEDTVMASLMDQWKLPKQNLLLIIVTWKINDDDDDCGDDGPDDDEEDEDNDYDDDDKGWSWWWWWWW